MINKSKTLVLGLAALMTLGLVSCGGGSASDTGASSAGGDTPTTDVPVVEGSYTLYFHFKASEKVKELASWTSPFIDGYFNGWDAHPGIEMKALKGTDIYYAQIEDAKIDWETNKNDLGYQLCLGYNASSNVGASMQGIAGYTYKNDFATLFSGTNHPSFATKGAAAPTNKAIELVSYNFTTDLHTWDSVKDHYMTFAAQPIEPVQLTDYTLKFDASDALIAGLTAHDYVQGLSIKGSFNDWTAEALTYDSATKTYSIKIPTVIAGGQLEFCIAPTTKAIRNVEDAYLLTETFGDAYNGTKAADTVDVAGKITKVGNLMVTPIKSDGNNCTNLVGKLDLIADYVWPTAPVAMPNDITITLTNSGTGALKTGVEPAVAGSFNEWKPAEAANKMTVSTDGNSYTYVIDKSLLFIDVSYSFDIATSAGWTGKISGADAAGKAADFTFDAKANFANCDIVGDWSKLGVEDSIGTMNYHGNFVNGIVITLTNSGTGTPAATPAVAGGWDGWSYTTANLMTLSADGKSYTYTFADNVVNAGAEYQFGIITNSNWAGKLVMADPADSTKLTNYAFTAKKGFLHVNCAGDWSKMGVTDAAGTIEYVA